MSAIGDFMRLSGLVQPPDAPIGAYGDWKRFASVNGFPPPEDYRMMIREYGVGTFGDWVHLIEPFPPVETFIEKAQVECNMLRRSRQQYSAAPNWPIWPDPGGFLPWATTADGDHIGWRTQGRPNTWTTLFWGSGGNYVNEYPVGACGFLVGLAERSLGDPNFDDAKLNPFVGHAGRAFQPLKS